MRRLILIGLGIFVATSLILGIWAHLAIGAKWSRLEERVRELEADTRWVAPETSEAWKHYGTAMSLIGDSSYSFSPFEPLPDGKELLKGRTTLLELGPAFEALCAGARSQGVRHAEFELQGRDLGRAAVLQARLWRVDGRLHESADLLLSAATFARDIADDGKDGEVTTGLEILDDAWEELRLLIAEKGLSEADGAEIAQRLETLDRRFPKTERSMRLWVLWNAQELLRNSSKFDYLGTKYPVRARLGSLYSVRLHKANAFDLWESYLHRFRGCDAKPWGEIEQITKEIAGEFRERDTDVLKLPLMHFADPLGRVKESLAQLRLLRVALAFRRTGSAPPLEDPFGGTIDAEVSGPSLTAWSKGMGLMDHQKSDWKRAGDMMEALNRGSIRIDLRR